MASSVPRAVLVSRRSEYDELVARHGTRDQARFFLETRQQEIGPLEERQKRVGEARQAVLGAVPTGWRRGEVERSDLDRFLFEPGDIVLVLGQDGLVANTAKYLAGQPVIGLNPEPEFNEGVLVPHSPARAADLIAIAADGGGSYEERTMVETVLDDGRRLLALNEVFIGHRSHQSARYRLRSGEIEERQSSSGIVVTTGTGATGWGRSIHRQRNSQVPLPAPCEARLSFFVREAWPSVATGTELVEGPIAGDEALVVTSELNHGGVIFGDGVEPDRLDFGFGVRATVRVAEQRLRLLA